MAMDRRRGGYMPLRDAIDQLFETSFITPSGMTAQAGYPPVDMHVTEDDVVVKMAVPGATPDDINISVTGDTVVVSGEVTREQRDQKTQSHFEEIWYGAFQRAFALPVQVDANKADATFEHGILTLTLPKAEATKPRKIQVKAQSQQQTIQGESSSSKPKASDQSATKSGSSS